MSRIISKDEISFHDGGKTIRVIEAELATASGAKVGELTSKKDKFFEDCWIIIHGIVYDVTNFLNGHPGGGDSILVSAGKDATLDFEDIHHSIDARMLLKDFKIGKLEGYTGPEDAVYKTDSGNAQEGSYANLFPIFVAVMAAVIYILKN